MAHGAVVATGFRSAGHPVICAFGHPGICERPGLEELQDIIVIKIQNQWHNRAAGSDFAVECRATSQFGCGGDFAVGGELGMLAIRRYVEVVR